MYEVPEMIPEAVIAPEVTAPLPSTLNFVVPEVLRASKASSVFALVARQLNPARPPRVAEEVTLIPATPWTMFEVPESMISRVSEGIEPSWSLWPKTP